MMSRFQAIKTWKGSTDPDYEAKAKRVQELYDITDGKTCSTDKLYGHVKAHKRRTEFLAFRRYVRSLHQITERLAIVMDNYGPHLSTKVDTWVGDWAAANNVELAYVPYYSSWLNRIEPQFTALRNFALVGTDHPSHRE
jgi:transposase